MSVIPQELVEDAWEGIRRQELLRAEQAADGALAFADTRLAEDQIALERERFVRGLLEVEEFELRVDLILHGDRWWEEGS